MTALWVASQQGLIGTVRRLHKAEAQVIMCESSQRRSIHQACENAHLEIFKNLVQTMGEDVNAKPKTPSHRVSSPLKETKMSELRR